MLKDRKKAGNGLTPRSFEGKEETKIQGVSLGNINHAGSWAAVDVQDGKIVRIRPFHYKQEYPDFRTFTIEARGQKLESSNKSLLAPLMLAYKKRIYSPNRIKYPLKRIDWDPNGRRNTENRGKSKFKRISWEQATDIMASEVIRIREKYGPEAVGIFQGAHGETKTIHASHGMNKLLMDCLGKGGEFTDFVDSPTSWEGSVWGSKHVWGFEPFGEEPADINMLVDVARNTEMMLYWPCDVESLGWLYEGQLIGRVCTFWKNAGIESIFISPDFNATAAVHADKWIPILPNTDAALLLAVAYVWMKEGTYDKEYIVTHTYGYGKFEDYVLGREDGIPKTPEWASPICAIPEWKIKALAREWASRVTSTAANHGGGMVRGVYSHEMMRLQVLLLAMQGVGKPGVHQTMMLHLIGFQIKEGMQDKDRLTNKAGYRCSAATEFKSGVPAKQELFRNRLADCILNPPVTWRAGLIARREDQFREHRYPKDGCSQIHMIWSDCPCLINCGSGGNRQIEALRSPKIEFIAIQHPWLENQCLYADLILPISTKFELDDIGYEDFEFSALYLEHKCIEPVGESKSDYEALIPLAEKLGIKEKYTGGKSIKEWQKYTFEKSGAQKLVSWEEFVNKGYVIAENLKRLGEDKPELQHFYDDPEAHPLRTPTGLIEFESQGLKEHFPDDVERPPVPHYIAEGVSHQESLSCERARVFPLLLMSTPPRFRIHAQGDDVSWTREIYKVKGSDGYMYEPAWLHPTTAAERGIKSGDIVKIYNERGSVLAGAIVTERIIPRAVRMDHGSRHDPIIPGKLDRGGNINSISPNNVISKNADGYVLTGYLVEVERVTVAQMDEWRQQYPEAFEREYEPASGLRFNAWVEGGM